MLLAIDIGNTHTVFGVFKGAELRAHWRLATRTDATEDEIGVLLRSLLADAAIAGDTVEGVIIASVVPELDAVYAHVGQAYGAGDPLFVGPGIKTGMPIHYESPHAVGADRIVNSVAALTRYGAPVIVLDFGTATTFDVVGPGGEYLGGVIAPGLGLSADALFTRAARLHRVDVRRPARVIGRNTEQSLQAGLFHGYVGLIEGLVCRIRAELGHEAPVVATGGLAPVFAPELDFLRACDSNLTLDGLRLLWDKNRK